MSVVVGFPQAIPRLFTAFTPLIHKNHKMWVSAAMRDTIRSGTEGDKAWLESASTKKLGARDAWGLNCAQGALVRLLGRRDGVRDHT